MLSWLPGAVLSLQHATIPWHMAHPPFLEMGGAGCVTCFAGIWGLVKCRSIRSNSNNSRTVTQSSVSTESGQSSAMYSPPPDPTAFSNHSDYASAFVTWNQAEMHRINLHSIFHEKHMKIGIFLRNLDEILSEFHEHRQKM